MPIPIKDLKAGQTYAVGQLFTYIFQVIDDGDHHLMYRLWLDKQDRDMAAVYIHNNIKSTDAGIIAHGKSSYIREATPEETQYLNQCIQAGTFVERDLEVVQQIIPSYQIY